MVLTLDPALAGEGVFVEFAGALVVPQRMQVVGEIVCRCQGEGVVLAMNPLVARKEGFLELSGRLIFTDGS